MEVPRPPQAVAALAAFVRARLLEVSDTIGPRLGLREDAGGLPVLGQDSAVVAAARQFAMVLVGAAAPFAPTSYSRARLVRQMHASGLLSDDEVRRATALLDVDARTDRPAGASADDHADARSESWAAAPADRYLGAHHGPITRIVDDGSGAAR